MKGKQLSLQEVLDLEDGTKVWIDKDNKYHDVYKKEQGYLIGTRCNIIFYIEYDCPYEAYLWIDEDRLHSEDKMDTITYFKSTIEAMATEICNLRSLDLTDDNIDKIIKEFS